MQKKSIFIHPYYYSIKKRVFDLVLSITLLALLSPFIILIAMLVFTSAGWPIIFIQKRFGEHKKEFFIFKFRTMRINAESERKKIAQLNQAPQPMFKIKDDPRFVGWGKWLSMSGLDELPQLMNIVYGQMSIVGPRPLPIHEAKKLNKTWDFRYKVKPGMVSEWVTSENKYDSLKSWRLIEEKSLLRGSITNDIRLLFSTAFTIIKNNIH